MIPKGKIRSSISSHSVVFILAVVILFHTQELNAESLDTSLSVMPNKHGVTCDQDSKFSMALGVLIGNEIAKEHVKLINPELFLNAIVHQMSSVAKMKLSGFVTKSPDKDDSSYPTVSFPSISDAEKTLASWQESSLSSVSENFIEAYQKHFSNTEISESGLLVREYESEIHDSDEINTVCEALRDKNLRSDLDINTPVICFQRHKIERKTACLLGDEELPEFPFNKDEMKVDQFPSRYFGLQRAYNVIEGWKETLDILESRLKEAEIAGNSRPILEVIIPPDLAYGDDHVEESVTPGETLWFLVTSIDAVSEIR